MRSILAVVTLVVLLGRAGFAAPISGQGIVSVFFEPANPGESKLDQIAMDVETGLRFQISIGEISLNSISIFSFKGPEFQAFELRGGLAIFMRHIGIFAPNIIEVSDDPFWTVSKAVPELPGCPPSCLAGLPLRMFLDDLASPLDLSKMLDPTLDEPLQFRKLISQVGIDLAGLRFSVTLLLANWGTPQSPSFETGAIFEAGGLTIGGLEVLAQTYIGARQGWECFGECKPWERFFEGQVVSGFDFQQEKLIVRNLRISGITFGFELVFDFASVGFSQLSLSARGALLGVLIQQEIVFDYQATPSFLRWAWAVRWGEALFTLELIDPDGGTLDFSMKRIGLFIDWAATTLRNELVLQNPFGLVHLIEITVGLEPFQFTAQTVFMGGLLNGFYTQRVRGEWRFIEQEGWEAIGGIETQMRREYLLYVGPFISIKF